MSEHKNTFNRHAIGQAAKELTSTFIQAKTGGIVPKKWINKAVDRGWNNTLLGRILSK